jgi:hypothetical protein
VRGLPADQALIDGEAVVLRKDGRSDFGALLTKRGGAEATLMAFDLVRLDGDDLRLKPLEARREALRRLVAGVNGILFSEALASEGAVVFAKACELDLEGIVVEVRGQLLSLRAEPQLAESQEPGFRQDGTAMPRRNCKGFPSASPVHSIGGRHANEEDQSRTIARRSRLNWHEARRTRRSGARLSCRHR